MGAIGLNPIRLDRIGLDPIRINAIKLGVPGASSDRPYIDPEVLASLKAVCICYGKSNDDPDRAVVKNLVDPDNPFVISNAAYDKMSSYGGYSFAKFDDIIEWELFSSDSIDIISRNGYSITLRTKGGESFWGFRNIQTKGFQSNNIPFKVRANKSITVMWDVYGNAISDGHFFGRTIMSTTLNPDQNTTISLKHMTEEELNKLGMNKDGMYYGIWFNLSTLAVDEEVTIEMLPLFEGAFVTDGINDLITSTKTVQEMLGGSNEITVVSMIHQIGLIQVYGIALTNYIRNNGEYLRSAVNSVGKTGIYGYTANNLNQSIKDRVKVINTILGDKKDYMASISDSYVLDDSLFHVQNYTHDGIISGDDSQLAWYWTIIANKVLTTDQINQVIAYYNLDRTLRPDILCNITKQGITNDNHADFNDKLIDYSGNGRDIQMNNLAWKGGSGIAAKQYETFKDWTSESSSTSIITQIDEFTRIVESTTNGYWVSRIRRDSDLNKVYDAINVYLYQDNNFLVHECKYEVDGIKYAIPINESVGKGYHKLEMYTKDRYTELPENAENVVLSEWYFPKSTKGSIKYSIIPSCKGGILLDGINDFGKVTGMPVYKDFTVVTDREIFANIGAISSKNNPGAFLETAGNSVYCFGQGTSGLNFISTRSISYLSKYSYCGQSITAGAAEDGTDMWLGTIRDNDSRFFNGAIYSLMTFPYSMSEFLIERQLKKRKAGTLYPDMVEFRPIVKSNASYDNIVFYYKNEKIENGTYLTIGYSIGMHIRLSSNPANEIKAITVNGVPATFVFHDTNNSIYQYKFDLTSKSPQKIDITIYQPPQYLTMLSNSTLISNETLIKNE